MALAVTDEAMRACGGAAFSRDLSVERNFRDARAASIMAPPRTRLRFHWKGRCSLRYSRTVAAVYDRRRSEIATSPAVIDRRYSEGEF